MWSSQVGRKLGHTCNAYMWKFFQPKYHIWLWQEFKLYHTRNSSCSIFVFFQKINLQNFSVTWNKINNSSDLLISYPSITQTQIKYMLPTSFKFRVNSYIKIVVSKTRENLRLKTRYLKGITTEQLFITSIMPVLTQRIYLGDAHENNQCFFSIVQLLHNIFEYVYNPGN